MSTPFGFGGFSGFGESSGELSTFEMMSLTSSGETDLVSLLDGSRPTSGDVFVSSSGDAPLSLGFIGDEYPDQSKESWESLPLTVEPRVPIPNPSSDDDPFSSMPFPSSSPTVTPEDVFPGMNSVVPEIVEHAYEEDMDEDERSELEDVPLSSKHSVATKRHSAEVPSIIIASTANHSVSGLAPAYVQVHTLRYEDKKLVAKDRIFDVHFVIQGVRDLKYVTDPMPEKWEDTDREYVLNVRMHDTFTDNCLHPNVAVCVKRLTKSKDLVFSHCQASFSVVIRKAAVEDWPPVRRCTKREFKLRCWLERRNLRTGSSQPVSTVAESETILWAGNRRIAAKATLCDLRPWPTADGSVQWPKVEEPSHSRRSSVSSQSDLSPSPEDAYESTYGAVCGGGDTTGGEGVGSRSGSGIRGHLRSRSLNIRHMRTQGMKRKDAYGSSPYASDAIGGFAGLPSETLVGFSSTQSGALGVPYAGSGAHTHSHSGDRSTHGGSPLHLGAGHTHSFSGDLSFGGSDGSAGMFPDGDVLSPPGLAYSSPANSQRSGFLRPSNPPMTFNSRYGALSQNGFNPRERRLKSLSMTATMYPPVRLEPAIPGGGYGGGTGSHRRTGSETKKARLSNEFSLNAAVDAAHMYSPHSFQHM